MHLVARRDQGDTALEGGPVKGTGGSNDRDARPGDESRRLLECPGCPHVLYHCVRHPVTVARHPGIVKWRHFFCGCCCSWCAGRSLSWRCCCIPWCGCCCCRSGSLVSRSKECSSSCARSSCCRHGCSEAAGEADVRRDRDWGLIR